MSSRLFFLSTAAAPEHRPRSKSMPFHGHRHHKLLFLLFLFCPPISGKGLIVKKSRIPNCPSFDCGDGISIEYPFWVPQKRNSGDFYFCGYVALQVKCQGNTPIVETMPENYTVKSIDHSRKTVSLVDDEVLTQACPVVRHQLDISRIFYVRYAPSVINLIFYYQCSNHTHLEAYHVKCLDNPAGVSYVFVGMVDPSIDYELSMNCRGGKRVAPVLESALGNNNATQAFPAALKSGFEVQWEQNTTKQCITCEGTGGFCGYSASNNSGYEFICFCEDGLRHAYDCNQYGRRRTKIFVAVGVVSFVAVVFLVLFLILHRCGGRKKRTSSATTSLIRSISSPKVPELETDPESLSNHYFTHIFSYKELEDATDGFDSSRELGDGGFGTVYKGKLRDGRTVAVKRLYEHSYRRVEQFMNEVEILSRLRHQNLVTLYGCTSRHSNGLLLVYEFVCNGTVADHLHGPRANERVLNWPVRMSIAVEIADALAYLHAVEPQIIHRDVKTSNILLDHSYHVKVADFGLSRLFPLDVTHVSTAPQGTPGYVDPEYHHCYQLTDKSDVYSFGVVLVELISSKAAVDITRDRQEINLSSMALNKISKGLVHELIDPELGFESDRKVRRKIELVAELAFRCLQAEKDMRPTMEEVKEELVDLVSACKVEKYVDSEKMMRDEKCLLDPQSPNTVITKWCSKSSSPNVSA